MVTINDLIPDRWIVYTGGEETIWTLGVLVLGLALLSNLYFGKCYPVYCRRWNREKPEDRFSRGILICLYLAASWGLMCWVLSKAFPI